MLNKLRIKIKPEIEVDEEEDDKNDANSVDDKRANASQLFEENLSFLRNLKFLKSWPKLNFFVFADQATHRSFVLCTKICNIYCSK